MREGWQTLTGEDLTTKITKGSSPKWQGFEYQSDGVLFVTSENVRGGFLDVSKPKFLPIEFSQKARNSRLNYGDILVNIVGASIGRACQFNLKGVEANVNQAVCVLRLKPEFESQFVLYLLQAPHVQRRLLGERSDSARPNLSLTDFREFSLDLPPLPEQRKIAAILRTWDEALEKLTALRAGKEDRLAGLRDTLMARASRNGRSAFFGDFLAESRIPGSNGATARKISVRLYGKGAVQKNGPRSGSANTRYYRREVGQIIWSKLDFLNGAFALIGPELDGCESTLDLPTFDCEPAVNPIWLIEYLTRSAYYTRQLHLARGQRKARRIAPDDWLASRLRLPNRATQDHIADVLTCARTELALLDAKIDALTQQKRGLMQKLLTGEWRVNVDGAKGGEA